MQKISPSRLNLISTIAAAIGFGISDFPSLSTAAVFKKQRGPAPAGMKWRDKNVYIPGGHHPNVEPTIVRNPKIAANVNMMHDKWQDRFIALPSQESPYDILGVKPDASQ